MKTIITILRKAFQIYWRVIKEYGVTVIVASALVIVVSQVWYYNSSYYKIRTFENTFVGMLNGDNTPQETSSAALKMVSNAKNPDECIVIVQTLSQMMKNDKYDKNILMKVVDAQLDKDCQ